MSKRIMKNVALGLLFVFCWSSVGFAVELLPAQMQNGKGSVNSPQAAELQKQYLKSIQSNQSLEDIDDNQMDLTRSEAPEKKINVQSSDLEEYYSKTLTEEVEAFKFKPLQQFGYDVFRKSGVSLTTSSDQVVSPDYSVGPGDNFTVTMWGIAEGVFNVQVDPEGNIVLPKVGVVPVAGVKYGNLKNYIESQLGKYYEQVNVAVSIKSVTGIRVYVVGEVMRPGTFNISSLSTAYNALFSAGGSTKRGSLRDIRVLRGGRVIAHIDLYDFLLYGNRKQDFSLLSGDTIFVPVIGPVAAVAGNVRRSGIYELKGKSDLSDVIFMAGGILPTSYINRVQIQRVVAHDKRIVTDKQFTFAKNNPRFFVDIKDMDLVKIYPIFSAIGNCVYLGGAVKYPGPYQWREGMTIKDVVKSTADLTIGAYLPKAEIVRLDRTSLETFTFEFDLKKMLTGDNSQNYALQPGDRLIISSEMRQPNTITLLGEVKLPGEYTIAKGERISSVLKRAGGFTDSAYLFGAVFTRPSAKVAQTSSINELVNKMEADLIKKQSETYSGLSADQLTAKAQENQRNSEMIEKLKNTTTIQGRVIIALKDPSALTGLADDIALENGDQLSVPKRPNIVNVLGEVYSPNSLVYEDGKPASYYLAKVGGATSQANIGESYIVRADGSILSHYQGYSVKDIKLMPGDTVLIPQQFDHFDMWAGISNFTQWFYQAALGFAVIATYLKK